MQTIYRLGVIFSLRDKLTGAANAISDKFDRLRSGALRTGKVIAGMAVGAGLAMLPTVTTYASFEKTLAAVGAISGATEGQLKRIENRAIRLGIETEHSSNAAAQGFLELSKAGFSVDQQLRAIRPSLLLATAGQLELGEAARTMGSGIKGFGLDIKDAGRVTDVLIAATQKSQLRAEEYSMALGQLGQEATSTNQPFELMIAALGLLKDQGGTAIRRAEQMKTALVQLKAPTGAASDEISRLVRDASGNLLPLDKVIDRIEERMKGLDKTAQDAAAVKIFGREGLPVFQGLRKAQFVDPLTGEVLRGTAALRRFYEVLLASRGTGQQFAGTLLNTFAGLFKLLRGSIETFGNVVGKLFAEKLRPWVDALTKGLNAMIEWVRENPKAARSIADTAAKVALLGSGIGAMLLGLAAVMFLVKPFAAVLALFLFNPVSLGILAVLGLAVATAILVRRWEDFKAILKDASITEFFRRGFRSLGQIAGIVPPPVPEAAQAAAKTAQPAKGFAEVGSEMTAVFKSELANVFGDLKSFLAEGIGIRPVEPEGAKGEPAAAMGNLVFQISRLVVENKNDPQQLVDGILELALPLLPSDAAPLGEVE